jgi:hypothetical protein
MRNSITISVVAAGLAAAILSSALASQGNRTTIEQCASLLPRGKIYTFEVTGSVDTKGAAPKLSGEMTVSDGTTVDRRNESAAFGQCIGKLIK